MLAEHLLHGTELQPAQFLNLSIILRANLHLFREAHRIVGTANQQP